MSDDKQPMSVANRLREMADELEERSLSLLRFDNSTSLVQAVQEVRELVGKKYRFIITIEDDDYTKGKTDVKYTVEENRDSYKSVKHDGESLREVLAKVMAKFAPDDVTDLESAMTEPQPGVNCDHIEPSPRFAQPTTENMQVSIS